MDDFKETLVSKYSGLKIHSLLKDGELHGVNKLVNEEGKYFYINNHEIENLYKLLIGGEI